MKIPKIIIIIFLITSSIKCKSQNSVSSTFYNSIKNEFPNYTFIKKEEFKDLDYFQSFINLLNEKNNEKISMMNPNHLAFEILKGNNDVYRINFITFDIKNNVNESKKNSGQFNTKALISYIYIEKKGKGYLLLFNKFINYEDIIIKVMNENLILLSDKNK